MGLFTDLIEMIVGKSIPQYEHWYHDSGREYEDDNSTSNEIQEKQELVEKICGKCGGTGYFQGTTGYGGGPSVKGRCQACNGTGQIQL